MLTRFKEKYIGDAAFYKRYLYLALPMILQNVTFGYILEHFLHNDSRLAITFAGVLLILAAIATALISVKKGDKVNTILPPSH